MKKMIPLLLTVLAISEGLAQVPTKEQQEKEKAFQEQAQKGLDTTKALGWSMNLVSGLNLTQVAYKDWSQGGEDALAYTSSIVGKGVHTTKQTEFPQGN